MHNIRFSLKNYPSQHEAYKAWMFAKHILFMHDIPFREDVHEQEVFVKTDMTGKMVFSKVFTIRFYTDSDLTAYQLIKD